LPKPGPLPDGPEWRFELKLDGFRAIVSTTGGLRVRSRRGWDMTPLVPELADLPPRLTLDGELVAFGEDKLPSFPRLCERMLHGRPGIPVAYMIFDVVVSPVEGRNAVACFPSTRSAFRLAIFVCVFTFSGG
jgi:ATP-dependent DNA ligase